MTDDDDGGDDDDDFDEGDDDLPMRRSEECEYWREVNVAEEQVEREKSPGDHQLLTNIIINCKPM